MIYIEWIKQLGTPEGDASLDVTTDNYGNVYISGYTIGSLDGITNAGGSADAWVAKYDTLGNLLWVQQIGTPEGDDSVGVATDSNGNVYISGIREVTVENTNAGWSADAWVAKYDTQGNLLWTKQFGTPEIDASWDVTTDNYGNVYISGETDGSLGDTNVGDLDAWVAKYNGQGNLLWSKQLGTSREDNAHSVVSDSFGNVYISGTTEGSLGDTNVGGTDAWVAKYDTQGNLLWTRQFGTSGEDDSWDVTTDSYGNVYFSVNVVNNVFNDLDITSDAWIVKYDTQGNLLWTQQFATSEYNFISSIATDNNDYVYVSGETDASVGDTSISGRDAWVAKYDTQGNLLWTEQLGTPEEDRGLGVVTDNNGNVYISGETEGRLGEINIGGKDAWIAKINQSNIISINRFQNSSFPGTYLYTGLAESQGIRDNFPNFIKEGQAFKVAIEPGDDLIPMNRFQNSNIPGTYLYAGEEESKSIRENFSNFIEEGIAFYVFPWSTDIGVDFYRFQNLDVPGTYIFAGPEERQNILDNYPNFVEEGVAFKAEI